MWVQLILLGWRLLHDRDYYEQAAVARDRAQLRIVDRLTACSTVTIIMKVTGGGKPMNTNTTPMFESIVMQNAQPPEP
jgi:hypothetical protein